ncbi:hypothetical protein CLV92_11388 [Kineococcus xinjiangensis]|uniref:Uncharacterized protein n=1 Tax=Kineococcus xinjiangensis TaxID=512762 RepID=A0A2S6IEM9_9ACTN|nr:hypothetical protein [Kineococcus xinjiangensis]PPK92659.1 hypothetical protein CLV92_11388 [Kineococcus xinjiangensis]
MTTAAQSHEVPHGVLLLLQRATGAGLLSSAEAMAAALTEAGWVRGATSGSWSYNADASWTVESADHAPNLSIFTHGDDEQEYEQLLHLADALHAVIDSGQAGAVQPGAPDPDWSTWSGGDVVLSLNVTPQRQLGKHRLPALLQLAIERADTPSEGLTPDPQRARSLAREGSPITRWYLAGEDHLPDDVVALLGADEDAAVVAALDANEGQRRLARGER